MRRGSGAARRRGGLAIAGLIAVTSCQPYTRRPAFGPLPSAAEAVVDLDVAKATTTLADALKADTIPVSRVEPLDGYLETPWFNTVTGKPTTSRILGDSLVRVRGWVNAYGEERGSIRVETAMRTLANPSLPERELDQQAPADNPTVARVAKILTDLAKRYPVPGVEPPAAPAASNLPQTKPDSTAQAPADSLTPKQHITKPVKPRPPGAT
jgi:hypothetical protein